MTSLLAASRENFAATLGFHAYAEAMRFSAATAARLVCALRQNNPPLVRGRSATRVAADAFANRCLKISAKSDFRAARTACFELFSVFDGRVQGQETIRNQAICQFPEMSGKATKPGAGQARPAEGYRRLGLT